MHVASGRVRRKTFSLRTQMHNLKDCATGWDSALILKGDLVNAQRYAPTNKKKNFLMPAIATIARFAIWTLLGVTFMVITGCGGENTENAILKPTAEETAMKPEGLTDTLGAMKAPVAAAPQAPGVGAPSVTSVGYFKDWKRTKPITEAKTGDLVYIQITFSEAMEVVAADDKTARPVIYYKTGKKLTRFRVVPLGSRGEDFIHGDIKPVKGAATFVGKYQVPEGVETFTIAVGKHSADLQGTPLGFFYRHKEVLQIRHSDTTPPMGHICQILC